MSKYEKLIRKTLLENKDVSPEKLSLLTEPKVEEEFDKKYAFLVIEPIANRNRHLHKERPVLAISKEELAKFGEPTIIENWRD